jgi:hypothetical protein
LGSRETRLILSSYQDGTGQQALSGSKRTLPGWRDFERAVAATVNGEAQESKYIFDVMVAIPGIPGIKYGISCKMRSELDTIARKGRVTMELSNSANKFSRALQAKGIEVAHYRANPREVGESLIQLVKSWHEAVSIANGGEIDLQRSSYLVLSWNEKREIYQLHQFALELPDPSNLTWHFPTKKTRKGEEPAARLCGDDEKGTIFEWYPSAGGQLKYFPLASDALWASEVFRLEPLPFASDEEYGILARARKYFPMQWSEAEKKATPIASSEASQDQ